MFFLHNSIKVWQVILGPLSKHGFYLFLAHGGINQHIYVYLVDTATYIHKDTSPVLVYYWYFSFLG